MGPRLDHSTVRILRAAVIVAAAFLIFWPVLEGGWLWDDSLYLTQNPLLREPGRLWKAWFAPGSFIEYYPLEQTLQWLQWKIFDGRTFGYHVTNVVLHTASAFLLWRLLARLSLRWAWLGGLLFVLHPMNVDSVANISEFKNTLSLPPFLLAATAWIDFEKTGRRRDYLRTLGWFLLAMLGKISVALFPFVMLLYLWWKRAAVRRKDLAAVAPFAAVSLVLSLVSISAGAHFEHLHPWHPAWPAAPGFLSRTALVGWIFADYFGQALFPIAPLLVHSQWAVPSPTPVDFLPWLTGAALFYFFWRERRRWGRHALLGVGFFVINLLPFSGIILTPYMSFTWTMDHLLYLPMIGLIGLAVAMLEQICARLSRLARRVVLAAVTIGLLALATESQNYAAEWTDGPTLWNYLVAQNPGAWIAHYNLGNQLRAAGRPDEAIAQYRETLRLNPGYDWAHNNLGIILVARPGGLSDAIAEYEAALRIRPDFPEAHLNLANALLQIPDRRPQALAEYQTALREEPDFVLAHYDLGIALSNLPGRAADARAEFERALRIDPDFAPAHDALDQLPPPGAAR
jgi:tetratricopeptide (TPR) repeat protein